MIVWRTDPSRSYRRHNTQISSCHNWSTIIRHAHQCSVHKCRRSYRSIIWSDITKRVIDGRGLFSDRQKNKSKISVVMRGSQFNEYVWLAESRPVTSRKVVEWLISERLLKLNGFLISFINESCSSTKILNLCLKTQNFKLYILFIFKQYKLEL